MTKLVKGINSVTHLIKNIVYLCGAALLISSSVWVMVNTVLEDKIVATNQGLEGRVSALEQWMMDDIGGAILRQKEKIDTGDTQDLKKTGIELLLKQYQLLNDPPPNIKIAYETIEQYYREHF